MHDRDAARGARFDERSAEEIGPTPGKTTLASKLAPTAAEDGVAGASAPLPYHDELRASFGRHGAALDGARARIGGPAADASAAIGAQAYATGDRVAFASAPDRALAAHEAAHVVQQRGGVARKATLSAASDPFEEHADQVADAFARGERAEPILDRMPGGAATGAVQRKGAAPAPAPDPWKDADALHGLLAGAAGFLADAKAVPQDIGTPAFDAILHRLVTSSTQGDAVAAFDQWLAIRGDLLRALGTYGAIAPDDTATTKYARYWIERHDAAVVDAKAEAPGGIPQVSNIPGAEDTATKLILKAQLPPVIERARSLVQQIVADGKAWMGPEGDGGQLILNGDPDPVPTGRKGAEDAHKDNVKAGHKGPAPMPAEYGHKPLSATPAWHDHANRLLDVFSLIQDGLALDDLNKMAEQFHKAGIKNKIIGGADWLNAILSVVGDGLSGLVGAVGSAMKLAGAVGADAVLETAGKIGGFFAYPAAALQCISGIASLVDAVKRGDEQEIVSSSFSIAEGAWAITAMVADMGMTPALAGTFMIYEWKMMFDLAGQLGGALRAARLAQEVMDGGAMAEGANQFGTSMRQAVDASFAAANADSGADGGALAGPLAAKYRGIVTYFVGQAAHGLDEMGATMARSPYMQKLAAGTPYASHFLAVREGLAGVKGPADVLMMATACTALVRDVQFIADEAALETTAATPDQYVKQRGLHIARGGAPPE